MRWKKVTIVGVGLLGGSLGLAMRKRGLAAEVAGYVRRATAMKECERAGALDYATTDLLAAVDGADLVILCTPLAQMKPLVTQMQPALKPGVIVTDVGSVKGSVVQTLESLTAKAGGYFVGSHPMAGLEKTGVGAARADLFQSAVCVTTPTKRTNLSALRKVERFWKAIGCRILQLTPVAHDQLVSHSSHLPQLVAALLAHEVLDPRFPREQSLLCAGGFRDTTRIASGSPEMWRDIALANRTQLGKALAGFIRELQGVQALLRRGDSENIYKLLTTAKARRDAWLKGCVSTSPE